MLLVGCRVDILCNLLFVVGGVCDLLLVLTYMLKYLMSLMVC